jgi:hypothetical protein
VNVNRETGTTKDQKVYRRGRRAPTVGITLRQEQLVFIKATRNIMLFPLFMRELRKALAAEKKKKALTATKDSVASTSVLDRPSGFGAGAPISRDPLQIHVS